MKDLMSIKFNYFHKCFKIILFLFITFNCIAQVPNKISYQAIVKNSNGSLVINQSVGVQISILKGDLNGASLYIEKHVIKTNNSGYIQFEIGSGQIQSGNISNIVWSSGPYFLKTEIDPTGGTNYSIYGSSQLISVPYAFYAATADSAKSVTTEKDPVFQNSVAKSISASDTTKWNAKQDRLTAGSGITISNNTISTAGTSSNSAHYIGERFGGGVIFHLWRDSTGSEHGLVVSITNQSDSYEWSNVIKEIGSSAQSMWNGLANSNAIISQSGHVRSAAKLCLDLVNNGYSDWYLPSIYELKTLYSNILPVSRALTFISGATQFAPELYWSSTENPQFPVDGCFQVDFSNGEVFSDTKDSAPIFPGDTYNVRAIRSF